MSSAANGSRKLVKIWKPNPAYISKVLFFRHVLNSQVVLTEEGIQRKNLKQIIDVTLRSPYVRPDHWMPFIALTGFPTREFRDTLVSFVRYHIVHRPHSAKYLSLPKRLRIFEDMEQTESCVLALCDALHQLPDKRKKDFGDSEPHFKLYWQQLSLRELPTKKGYYWPKYVEHDKLILKRGREILNSNLLPIPKAVCIEEIVPDGMSHLPWKKRNRKKLTDGKPTKSLGGDKEILIGHDKIISGKKEDNEAQA
ncbi:hypothetical protein G9A89_020594 [Geosiphon pyriformis]|nr:hypothetical protein G9A89_020594 [Geosiphon pyriformis]